MREIGYYCLLLALLASFWGLVSQLPFKIIRTKGNQLVFDCYFAQTLAVAAAFVILVLCYLKDDFTVALVAGNSGIKMPLFYKVAASWSSHPGSLLLWELYITVFGFGFFYYKLRKEEYRFEFLKIQNLISCFFLSLLFFSSNPFVELYPRAIDGQGLNPILEDIALAIHPPILFAAYASFSIIYSLSIIRLKLGKIGETHILWPVKSTFALMTSAISLGSWWAYRELGWGGFWFWDPVENSSLLPWLISLSLLHAKGLGKVENEQIKQNLCGILGLVFALFATFLVRSGLITSVHSFASDSLKGLWILSAVIFFMSYAAYYMFQIKAPVRKQISSWHRILLISNLAIIFTYLVTVFFGTVAPLFYEARYGEQITVGSRYFNQITTIFSYIILIFMALANLPRLENLRLWLDSLWPVLTALVTVIFANHFLEIASLNSQALLMVALAMILSQMQALFKSYALGSNSLNIPMHLGHLAFALLIIAITIQAEKSFDIETKVRLGEGQYYNEDYYLKFSNIYRGKSEDYMFETPEFEVWYFTKFLGKLKPEIRFYREAGIKTNEVSILSVRYLSDLYATVEKYDESDYFYLRLQYKPLMSVIWLSAILMAVSVFFSFKKKG